tara:strand:- start:658 stop:1077 length:420 start_codon:yes stop_codon:yes gene_type:complete
MKFIRDNDVIFLRLDKNEEISQSILTVAKEHKVYSCWVNGIGAIKDIELGFYNLEEKKYEKKMFKGNYELVSFMGNITLKDGQPFLHSHVTISDDKFNSFGGHFFKAKIKVAGEFCMFVSEEKIVRKMNQSIGLQLWDF